MAGLTPEEAYALSVTYTNEHGGGGGTSNYNQLSNKPQINGVTLSGDKSAADLGLAESDDIPTKTSDLTNDAGFIQNTVNNLLNYYLKSESYTKNEVDALISAIVTLNIQSVSSLPTEDISTTTIYLVPSADPQIQNVKDEYIYVNNAWELIGSTAIDLAGYVTDADLTSALSSYATKAELANKQDALRYSDQEQVIGTWIDGKPLYQKTIIATFISGTIATLDSSILPKKMDVIMHNSDKSIQINPFYYAANNFWSVWIDNSVVNGVCASAYANREIEITIQYTKTTD